MEIKLSVKQPGRADVNFEFSCNAEEAAVLINDPVYQELGKKLISEISFKHQHGDRKDKSQYQQPRDDWRKAYGDIQRQVQLHNKAVDTAIDQINRMIERIIRNTDTRS